MAVHASDHSDEQPLQVEADVLIVGGGVVGVATALQLLQLQPTRKVHPSSHVAFLL